MALNKLNKPAPQFEEESEDTVVAAPQAEEQSAAKPAAKQPDAGAAASAQPKAAGALTVKPATPLALTRPSANMADHDVLALLENALPPVEFGEGERLTITNGAIFDGDNRSLGDTIALVLLSWNYRWVISPNDNGKEAKEHARYSMDGVTTTQGENIEEYLAELRANGYPKAAKKEYMDLFGILEDASKTSPHTGTALTLSISPDTVKSFKGFRRNLVVQGITGRMPEHLRDVSSGFRLAVTCEARSGNGNNWTRGNFAIAE